jgi:hypothetical protein
VLRGWRLLAGCALDEILLFLFGGSPLCELDRARVRGRKGFMMTVVVCYSTSRETGIGCWGGVRVDDIKSEEATRQNTLAR